MRLSHVPPVLVSRRTCVCRVPCRVHTMGMCATCSCGCGVSQRRSTYVDTFHTKTNRCTPPDAPQRTPQGSVRGSHKNLKALSRRRAHRHTHTRSRRPTVPRSKRVHTHGISTRTYTVSVTVYMCVCVCVCVCIVRSSSAPSGHAARDRQRRLVGPSKGY